jgi:hypothetical protein
MPHPLRWFAPDVVYEVTSRTISGRFLLKPTPQLKLRIIAVLARARQLCPEVKIFHFIVVSNHWHFLASSSCAEAFAQFLGYVQSNIAREAQLEHNWEGPVWSRRARVIPCLDDDATIARFKYLTANGTKEGLVDSPRLWPGASAVPALLTDLKLHGEWIDRTAFRCAQRKNKRDARTNPTLSAPTASDFIRNIELSIDPLPVWQRLSPDDLRRKHESMVCEVEAETSVARQGKPSLGVALIAAQHPHDRPAVANKSRAPQCHTTSQFIRDNFRKWCSAAAFEHRRVSKLIALHTSIRLKRAYQPLSTMPVPLEKPVAEFSSLLAQVPPGFFIAPVCPSPPSAKLLASIIAIDRGTL